MRYLAVGPLAELRQVTLPSLKRQTYRIFAASTGMILMREPLELLRPCQPRTLRLNSQPIMSSQPQPRTEGACWIHGRVSNRRSRILWEPKTRGFQSPGEYSSWWSSLRFVCEIRFGVSSLPSVFPWPEGQSPLRTNHLFSVSPGKSKNHPVNKH
jgi:hypothetical protein